jgi:hypothetical protein
VYVWVQGKVIYTGFRCCWSVSVSDEHEGQWGMHGSSVFVWKIFVCFASAISAEELRPLRDTVQPTVLSPCFQPADWSPDKQDDQCFFWFGGDLFYDTFSVTTLYSVDDGVTNEWWRINKDKHPCFKGNMNPRSQGPSDQGLRPRGHWDRRKLSYFTILRFKYFPENSVFWQLQLMFFRQSTRP